MSQNIPWEKTIKLWAIICGNSHLITLRLVSGMSLEQVLHCPHPLIISSGWWTKARCLNRHLGVGMGGWEMALITLNLKSPLILSQMDFIIVHYLLKKKSPIELSVIRSLKNRNTKHVIFIYITCSVLYLGFFVLFFSGVKEYYEDSFLSGEAICDFKLFLILYKLNLMPAQNNMRKLWEIVLEYCVLPYISIFSLFYPAVTVSFTKW